MGSISAVIFVVKDELSSLASALASVKSLVDEIVVIDMTEGEDLKSLKDKYSLKIYPHKKVPYVEMVRNFGMQRATGDWIIIIDPDEELPQSLKDKLKEISSKSTADYYRIPRKNFVFGKWMKYSRWWPDLNIRFFKKGKVSWNELIHSVPITTGRGEDFPAEERYSIIHQNYLSLSNYFEKMNRYTTVQSQALIAKNYKFIWKDLIKKPLGEFLSRYFAGEGYKDGVHGLALALLQAFSELTVYLKVWEEEKFLPQAISVEEINTQYKEGNKEFLWWIYEAQAKEENIFTAYFTRLKRKLISKHVR